MAQPQCCHDHECDEDCGLAFSLYKHIDIPQARHSGVQPRTAAAAPAGLRALCVAWRGGDGQRGLSRAP